MKVQDTNCQGSEDSPIFRENLKSGYAIDEGVKEVREDKRPRETKDSLKYLNTQLSDIAIEENTSRDFCRAVVGCNYFRREEACHKSATEASKAVCGKCVSIIHPTEAASEVCGFDS